MQVCQEPVSQSERRSRPHGPPWVWTEGVSMATMGQSRIPLHILDPCSLHVLRWVGGEGETPIMTETELG